MTDGRMNQIALILATLWAGIKAWLFPAVLVFIVFGAGVGGCVYEGHVSAAKDAAWEQYRSEHHCQPVKVDSTGKREVITFNCNGIEHTRISK